VLVIEKVSSGDSSDGVGAHPLGCDLIANTVYAFLPNALGGDLRGPALASVQGLRQYTLTHHDDADQGSARFDCPLDLAQAVFALG
jgi:hypothetical protein